MNNTKKTTRGYTLTVFAAFFWSLVFPCAGLKAAEVPKALATLTADDGSVWEQVSLSGFGSLQNLSITSLCSFNGSLYAATRNEETGFELWKTQGDSWSQVTVPGFTDSIFHPLLTNGYGAMIEYDGHLYVGVGSRYEGAFLYGSVGFEVWRFNGTQWEPVISNQADEDETGIITRIDGCSLDDGFSTADITDESKSWTVNQWKGGVFRITSGEGEGRMFDIVSNSADTLVVQQNEIANTTPPGGSETEFTVCDAIIPDEDHPELVAGAVEAGNTYEIGMGADENGFGEIWNKNLFSFAVCNETLYISIGHNYDKGTRIWSTQNGREWLPVSDYSFGLFHGYAPDGSPTDECLVKGTEDRNGGPVCSSTTTFGKSTVSGTETLYIGGTGSSGCNGRGSRVLKLDPADGQWRFIVDNYVDENDEGTNENGFGDADSFINQNFQAWSWAEYDERLLVGVARVTGGRIMYTETGEGEDDSWTYIVGGDATMPDGFDGGGNSFGYGANILPLLFNYNNTLYAGTFANRTSPAGFADDLWNGADIWKATGPVDSLTWSRVTGNGFDDQSVMTFGPFVNFEDRLYVAASNIFGNFPEDSAPESTGATVYRLSEVPDFVSFEEFTAQVKRFSITLSWTTGSERDCSGFYVYRSLSESKQRPYHQLTRQPLQATGSVEQGAAYIYNDAPLMFGKTYYYKIEAVDSAGNSSWIGPIALSTQPLFQR